MHQTDNDLQSEVCSAGADQQFEMRPAENCQKALEHWADEPQQSEKRPAEVRLATDSRPAEVRLASGAGPHYKKERIKDIKEGKKGEKGCGARIPSLGEVAAYVAAEGLRVDAADFVDYYAACDWKIRGSPIVNWQALARRWSRNEERKHSPGEAAEPLSVKRNHEGRVRE